MSNEKTFCMMFNIETAHLTIQNITNINQPFHFNRATKSDNQSKDDLDALRDEIASLRESLSHTEQKLAETVADSNRKINQLWTEMCSLSKAFHASRTGPTGISVIPPPHQSHHTHIRSFMQPPGSSIHAVSSAPPTSLPPAAPGPDNMMQSLSHIAGVKLRSPSVQSQKAMLQPNHMPLSESAVSGAKRGAPTGPPSESKRKK